MAIIKKMAAFDGSISNENNVMITYSFFAIAFLIAVELRREFFPDNLSLSYHRSFWVRNSYYALLIVLILVVGVYDGGQFIYFQF